MRDLPPSWTDLLTQVLRDLGVQDGSLVQLFAGGDQFTQALLPLADRLIVVGRSPDKLQEVSRRWPAVETVTGTANAIPLPDGSVDAVVVASPLALGSATQQYREIARVLYPGGRSAGRDAQRALARRARPARRPRLGPGHPRRSRQPGVEARTRGDGLFTSLSLTERACELDIGVDEFVALVGSWGWISDLPGEHRAAVLGAVRELVGSYATVTVRHHTEVCATRTVAG